MISPLQFDYGRHEANALFCPHFPFLRLVDTLLDLIGTATSPDLDRHLKRLGDTVVNADRYFRKHSVLFSHPDWKQQQNAALRIQTKFAAEAASRPGSIMPVASGMFADIITHFNTSPQHIKSSYCTLLHPSLSPDNSDVTSFSREILAHSEKTGRRFVLVCGTHARTTLKEYLPKTEASELRFWSINRSDMNSDPGKPAIHKENCTQCRTEF